MSPGHRFVDGLPRYSFSWSCIRCGVLFGTDEETDEHIQPPICPTCGNVTEKQNIIDRQQYAP